MQPSSILARNNDAWLTTKIKTQMLTDQRSRLAHQGDHRERHRLPAGPGHPAGGQLGHQRGAERSGVQKIVKLFEYID
jgi:hypothetical protein